MADAWLVVFTKPGAEGLVRAQLEELGVESRMLTCPRGRNLLPRYLFARDEVRSLKVKHLRGVTDLLRSVGSDEFARVSSQVIDAVRGILDDSSSRGLSVGDKVVLPNKLSGEVMGLSRDQVFVMVQLLGSARMVEVSASSLEHGESYSDGNW